MHRKQAEDTPNYSLRALNLWPMPTNVVDKLTQDSVSRMRDHLTTVCIRDTDMDVQQVGHG